MRSEAIASLVVIGILAGAGVGYLAGNQLTLARTSTETTLLTTTETALQSSASNSSWRFVVSMNATTVANGQFIFLWANLTNTSPSSKTIRPYVEPFINPSINAANGTGVWAWDPPEETWPNTNVTSGQTLSQEVVIPTTNLRDGIYTIDVAPLSSEFSESFNLTMHFAVGATTTQTMVSTVTTKAGLVLYTSSVSSDGLQLRVMLNSSTINPRGEVTVNIELLNTLNRNVSLGVVNNDNISAWDGTDFFCGINPSYSLVGFGVFSGHFTAENISKAGSPLQLAAPIEAPCPYRLPLNDTTFLPNSDKTISFSYYGQTKEPSLPVTAEVNATTSYCTSSPSATETMISCPTTSGLLGYWSPGAANGGNFTLDSKGFTYFPPGEYTIVATDDWNQNIYATFDVL